MPNVDNRSGDWVQHQVADGGVFGSHGIEGLSSGGVVPLHEVNDGVRLGQASQSELSDQPRVGVHHS